MLDLDRSIVKMGNIHHEAKQSFEKRDVGFRVQVVILAAAAVAGEKSEHML